MYPKHFFERFWEGEQKNILFVCMPFHESCDVIFETVFRPAAKDAGFDDAVRVKDDIKPNDIKFKILDGIANSKLILLDLSDDPKSACDYSKHVNGNVLYEAGIAHAVREPEAIIMIRDKEVEKVDFDIKGMSINVSPEGEYTRGWLVNLLKKALEEHDLIISKRVKAAAESIDHHGLSIMYQIGWWPKGFNHIPGTNLSPDQKVSLLRLMDLEIMRFACVCYENHTGFEWAYHWTEFGYAVMAHLNIHQISDEEFKKRPEYPTAVDQRENFSQKKEQILGK